MPISFEKITRGYLYSYETLAELWGYKSHHPLGCGVFTPSNDNKIVLFVTEEKRSGATQYVDCLSGNILEWEGPKKHRGEDRMINAEATGEEIHLFYRKRYDTDLTYLGRLKVLSHTLHTDRPSRFKFMVHQSG